jgi:hypothetical protein
MARLRLVAHPFRGRRFRSRSPKSGRRSAGWLTLTEGEPLLLRFYAEDLWFKTIATSPIALVKTGSRPK